MKKKSKKEEIIREKYRVIKKLKSSVRNENLLIVEDISLKEKFVMKKLKFKEKNVTSEMMAGFFSGIPLIDKNNIELVPLDFFLERDLCILFGYSEDKTLEIIDKFPSSGHIFRDRYIILGGISCSEFSRVYLAGDLKNPEKLWAVKEMEDDPDNPGVARDYFKRAVSVLTQINHSNIPKISELFIKKDKFYIIMEYIKGKTLNSYISGLNEEEFLNEDRILDMGITICEVIEHLHNLEIPIIYRVMDSDNLIFSEDGKLKFLDFGIARIYEDVKPPDMRYAYLKDGFAAPEVCDGKGEYTSDIYSFGAVMFYIITKLDPAKYYPNFPSPSRYNREISPDIDILVLNSLKLKKEDRYQSIEEIKEILIEIRDSTEFLEEEFIPETEDESTIYNRAKELRRAGELEDAITLYKKVLTINPEKKMAYYGLGLCYDELGSLEDALDSYEAYRSKLEDPGKIDKIEKKIKRLTLEIKEEVDRQDAVKRNREDKYRTYLEVKWINGVFEIPAIEQVRKRLKIDEKRAKVIEGQIQRYIEASLEDEVKIEEDLKKTMLSRIGDIKTMTWDGEATTVLPEGLSEKEACPEDEARKNYYMAVEMAWSRGDINEYDVSYLEKMRDAEGISKEEALEIEKKVKDNLKAKIKSAKEEWLKEEKEEVKELETLTEHETGAPQMSEHYRRVLKGPDLLEVRKAEVEEAKRRDLESKKLLKQELKRKKDGIEKYRDEVRSLWNSGNLDEGLYQRLRTQRALLGISDRDAIEIEREFEKKRKELLEEENRAKEETRKKLSENEKKLKKKELIPLRIEGVLKKGITDENKSSLIMREFPESGLKEIRAYLIMASGMGQYEDISENVSSIATKTFSKVLLENKDKFTIEPEISRSLLESIIRETLYEVFYRAYKDEISSLTINLTVILIIHNHYIIGTIGNMMGYVVTPDKIRHLTREYSVLELGAKEIKQFIEDRGKIEPAIFPMYMDTFFDIIPGEIIFLCDRSFEKLIGIEEIKRQLTETEELVEASEGLANLAYFIKEGSEDVVIAVIETGKMKRISSSSVIQFDDSVSKDKKSFLSKIKGFFKAG